MNRYIRGEIPLQKAPVNERITVGKGKPAQVVLVGKEGFQVFVEPLCVDISPAARFVEDGTREPLQRLHVHVFKKRQPGKLRPEGNIEGKSELQGLINVFMREYAHRSGRKVSFERQPVFHVTSVTNG